jgi:hypothetical protein
MTAPIVEPRRPTLARLVMFTALLTGVAWGLGAFSAYPWAASPPDAALLRVAFKHVAPFAQAAGTLSREDWEKLPRHMRPPSLERARTRTRQDTVLRVAVDGRPVLEQTYRPSGLRHDGPTFGYEELPLSLGRHRLEVSLADTGEADVREDAADRPGRWSLRQEVEVRPGRAFLVELSGDTGLTVR